MRTPTTFTILFYLILSTRLLRPEVNRFSAENIFLSIFIFFIHPIGFYLLLSTLILWVVKLLISLKFEKEILYKSLVIVSISIALILMQKYYLSSYSQSNPYSIDSKISLISNNPIQTFPALSHIINYYFKITAIPFGMGWLFLLLCILMIYKYGNRTFLTLWVSALILLLASSVYEDGYRSLDIIWPLTYMMYGYGLYLFYKLLNNIPLRLLVISGGGLFVVFNFVYSFWLADYYRNSFNYQFTVREFVKDITDVVPSKSLIYSDSKLVITLMGFGGLYASVTENPKIAGFYLQLDGDANGIQKTFLYKYLKSILNVDSAKEVVGKSKIVLNFRPILIRNSYSINKLLQ